MPRELYASERGNFSLREVDVPSPGENEILIQTELAAIKHGTEFHVLSGASPLSNKVFDLSKRYLVETEGGRALEIAANGRTVWEFHSPFRAGESQDKVASLYALERVDPSQTSWLNSRRENASQQQ